MILCRRVHTYHSIAIFVLLICRPGGGRSGPTTGEVNSAHHTAQRTRLCCSLQPPSPILSTCNAMNRIIDNGWTNRGFDIAICIGCPQPHVLTCSRRGPRPDHSSEAVGVHDGRNRTVRIRRNTFLNSMEVVMNTHTKSSSFLIKKCVGCYHKDCYLKPKVLLL